ncbi:MAG: hypothetical protein QHH06_13920, partial [Clostridiales bacterium]|nr:hypothetical protein [Clostridiales bacterium]
QRPGKVGRRQIDSDTLWGYPPGCCCAFKGSKHGKTDIRVKFGTRLFFFYVYIDIAIAIC